MTLAPGSHQEQGVAVGVASGTHKKHGEMQDDEKKKGNFFTAQQGKEPPIADGSEKKQAAKESGDIPNIGMFAAVHQENPPRPTRHNHQEEGSQDEDGDAGVSPGAFAVGGQQQRGRRRNSDRSSVQIQNQPHQQEHFENSLGIPLAAEVAPQDENRARESDEESKPIAQASTLEQRSWISERRNQVIVVVIFLLLVGIVITVVLLLREDDSPGNDTNQSENDDGGTSSEESSSLFPSASPTTLAPTTFADRIYSLIATYSGEEVLQDETTPQSQGLQWITVDASSSPNISDSTRRLVLWK